MVLFTQGMDKIKSRMQASAAVDERRRVWEIRESSLDDHEPPPLSNPFGAGPPPRRHVTVEGRDFHIVLPRVFGISARYGLVIASLNISLKIPCLISSPNQPPT